MRVPSRQKLEERLPCVHKSVALGPDQVGARWIIEIKHEVVAFFAGMTAIWSECLAVTPYP